MEGNPIHSSNKNCKINKIIKALDEENHKMLLKTTSE